MKKSIIILNSLAAATLLMLSGVASAEVTIAYATDPAGALVKNGTGGCWRTGYWTPELALAECDPDLVKKEEPKPAPVMAPPPPPPAPAPAPVVMAPKPPAFTTIDLQADALFDFDKAVLKDAGKQKLDNEVVANVKEYTRVGTIEVTGYTDRIGSKAYNLKLSQRRADAVKAYLVSQGVDEMHIDTVARGEDDPVAACENVKGWSKLVKCLAPNRRVEVSAKVQKQVN